MRPLLLVSDCHISPFRDDGTAEALRRLLIEHPQAELVLNGDTWDLSCGATGWPVGGVLVDLVKRWPHLADVLGARLRAGVPVTVIAGNHDAALTDPAVGSALRGALRVHEAAPLQIVPWWMRRGGLHVEHGHLFDPDNASLFPLDGPYPTGEEPLGVALTRRFVAPNRAFAFAHAHETTFLTGLGRSLRDYGPRTPGIVLDYYRTAVALTVEATRRRRIYDHEVAAAAWLSTLPDEQLEPVPAAVAARLLDALPAPTHTSGRATFKRLYLDRSLAIAVMGGGLLLASSVLSGLLAAGGAAAYLAFSLFRRRNRYAGLLEGGLADAASAVAQITGAETVVFGHTHREVCRGSYMNLGAFGIEQRGGRSWAHADDRGRVKLEHFRAS